MNFLTIITIENPNTVKPCLTVSPLIRQLNPWLVLSRLHVAQGSSRDGRAEDDGRSLSRCPSLQQRHLFIKKTTFFYTQKHL